MRLLDASTFDFREFVDARRIPPYAILSHTWKEGSEVVYSDLIFNLQNACQQPEFQKVRFTAQQALADGLKYIWVDTCCIDKSSSAELSEAINSMNRYYKEAQVCYVYLSDVDSTPPAGWIDQGDDTSPWIQAFVRARWFTRGWTLQELIAPRHAIFYTAKWDRIGTKRELSGILSRHTGISSPFLLGVDISKALVATRMSWAANRSTTRVEDVAYSLLGLFNIHMPLLYGEGESAFLRLQHEIIKATNDATIFFWKATSPSRTTFRTLFAASPSEFADFGDLSFLHAPSARVESAQNGVRITLPLVPVPGAGDAEFTAVIARSRQEEKYGVRVRRLSAKQPRASRLRHAGVQKDTYYARVDAHEIVVLGAKDPLAAPKPEVIVVPSSFSSFDFDPALDARLAGFCVAHYPIELLPVRFEPPGAWEGETLVLDQVAVSHTSASEKEKAVAGSSYRSDTFQIVFREAAPSMAVYTVDLIALLRPKWRLIGWSELDGGQRAYVGSVRMEFVGGRLMNVLMVSYALKMGGE